MQETLRIYLPFVIIGVVYFLIVTGLKKKFRIGYLKGLWLPLGVVILFFGLAVYARVNPQPGSWNDLVFAAMTAVSTLTLATYVTLWLVVGLFSKK